MVLIVAVASFTGTCFAKSQQRILTSLEHEYGLLTKHFFFLFPKFFLLYHNCNPLTHSLINHFETVPNSKKLQTTTEMWLLKD